MTAGKSNLRLVQLLVMLSGIGFIIAGAVILALNGADGGDMTVFGLAMIAVGFGDLVVAFFVFRGASEQMQDSRSNSDKSEQIRD